WVITDLQTTNGLFVRVSRTALGDKAEFLVGAGRYRFEAATARAADTPDAPRSVGADPSNRRRVRRTSSGHPMLVELNGLTPARIPLTKPECWIGSDPECAICRSGDPFVEPRHVRLYRDADGTWHAQNNKSANGLWYRVPQITVGEACLFQIGEQRFRLKANG